jgi:hypothetical protein
MNAHGGRADRGRPAAAAVFVINARGIAPVGQIDNVPLPAGQALMSTLAQVCESTRWDQI